MQKNDCSDTKMILKDFSSVEKIKLVCSSNKTNKILDFCAKLFLTDNKIIPLHTGYSLILKGDILIKIRFLSNDCSGKVFQKKLISPFFKAIPISECLDLINVKAEISYYDIDICDNNTIWFYNIISVCLSMNSTESKPIIKCLTPENDCNSDWHLKNDNYNSKTGHCYNDWQFKNDNYPSKTDHCYNDWQYKDDNYHSKTDHCYNRFNKIKDDCNYFNNNNDINHSYYLNKTD